MRLIKTSKRNNINGGHKVQVWAKQQFKFLFKTTKNLFDKWWLYWQKRYDHIQEVCSLVRQ